MCYEDSRRGLPALQVNNTEDSTQVKEREGPKCFSLKLRRLILKMIPLCFLQS